MSPLVAAPHVNRSAYDGVSQVMEGLTRPTGNQIWPEVPEARAPAPADGESP